MAEAAPRSVGGRHRGADLTVFLHALQRGPDDACPRRDASRISELHDHTGGQPPREERVGQADGGAAGAIDRAGTQADIKTYLGFNDSDKTKIIHAANRSTPMAGVLETALKYFSDPEGIVRTDALKQCRKNFILMVTDGGDSCLIDLTAPGQKAAALANIDSGRLDPELGKLIVAASSERSRVGEELPLENSLCGRAVAEERDQLARGALRALETVDAVPVDLRAGRVHQCLIYL